MGDYETSVLLDFGAGERVSNAVADDVQRAVTKYLLSGVGSVVCNDLVRFGGLVVAPDVLERAEDHIRLVCIDTTAWNIEIYIVVVETTRFRVWRYGRLAVDINQLTTTMESILADVLH